MWPETPASLALERKEGTAHSRAGQVMIKESTSNLKKKKFF